MERNKNNPKIITNRLKGWRDYWREKPRQGCVPWHTDRSLCLKVSAQMYSALLFLLSPLFVFFFFFSFQNKHWKQQSTKQSFSVYVCSCFRDWKKKWNNTRALCEREVLRADRQGFIIRSRTQSNVAPWREWCWKWSWGLSFCVWVVPICQLSMPVRDVQGCHCSSASICEVFCSCYTAQTVLMEGRWGLGDKSAARVRVRKEMSGCSAVTASTRQRHKYKLCLFP